MPREPPRAPGVDTSMLQQAGKLVMLFGVILAALGGLGSKP